MNLSLEQVSGIDPKIESVTSNENTEIELLKVNRTRRDLLSEKLKELMVRLNNTSDQMGYKIDTLFNDTIL